MARQGGVLSDVTWNPDIRNRETSHCLNTGEAEQPKLGTSQGHCDVTINRCRVRLAAICIEARGQVECQDPHFWTSGLLLADRVQQTGEGRLNGSRTARAQNGIHNKVGFPNGPAQGCESWVLRSICHIDSGLDRKCKLWVASRSGCTQIRRCRCAPALEVPRCHETVGAVVPRTDQSEHRSRCRGSHLTQGNSGRGQPCTLHEGIGGYAGRL